MNDDFDPLDHTLARELNSLAPSEFDLDAERTLGSMRPALQRARARRRLAVTSSALGVFAVVVVGAAALRQGSTSKVNIQGRSHPTVSTSVQPSTTNAPTTTRPPVAPPITAPDHVPSTTIDRQPSGSGPAPTITTPLTTQTTNPNRGETTTTVAPASTKTYSSVGGHATITFASGRLTLVSYAPAVGYKSDVRKNASEEIEIRFSNGDRESRIRVRVQDGKLRPEVTEN